ncbi:conserved hypothetical protein [Nostocoides australiense Ben110]|uniref:NAD-dependent epimerase/dehydratase domain-containing protein n=1 Tax=Nostocoides australiense Ben110 TaxID=1193182 RepID=W6JSQ4_9MICO|nr:NAD-dependent epimerase/dehydratase family protein [Tetrasphaera australiensis]CCH72088.1 conserved hypothetical protein [Tetrasphaera australiensis Ben110]
MTDAPVFPAVPGVVITGAGGWLGRALLARYEAERTTGRSTPRQLRVLLGSAGEVPDVRELAPTAQIHVGDIADPDAVSALLRGATGYAIVHAAGVIHPATVADFERVNAGGTNVLLKEAAAAATGRIVHISSNSPFGVNPRPDDRFRHDEPFAPWLGYGASKMHAELAVRDAVEAGQDVVIVRPPWFYGPWQPARQTTFFALVRTGRFPVLGGGQQQRSMVYTGNLVDGILLALGVPQARGGAFWIADSQPYQMADVVATVREVLAESGYAVSPHTLALPALIGRLAERGDRLLQRRGRYVQGLHVLGETNKTIACDIAHSTDVLGYRPRVALAQGMREAVRWCQARGIQL